MTQHTSESRSPRPTPGTDHVRDEDQALVVRLGEWGFKLLFGFFGAAATLLSWLAPRRDGRHS